MIIKKINIIAFGGLSNKIIDFSEGVNIIYGENEAGKSTIQNFIKIWLYGMQSKRSKDLKVNERIRFKPISGEKIRGELHVLHLGKEYIITRSFGATKKEDTSEVLDALTGEVVKYINCDEPGRYFLEVNSSTFNKTLFVSQLGVLVNKDREEDMMERATNLLGSGDENISVQRAIERLESIKKSLSTTRKTGSLDLLRNKYNDLLEERYEGYKLSEENIDNEERNIILKDERQALRKEIKNLEIYKKYMKKIKLKKEYEDITVYLKKSEELKKKERYIKESISDKNGLIDESLLNDIKEENSLYLALLDLKKEKEEKLNKNNIDYNEKRKGLSELLFVESIDSNEKENIIRASMEFEHLSEKIINCNLIEKEIEEIKNNIIKRKNSIGTAINFKNIRKRIEILLQNYEEKLKELKYRAENMKSLEKKFIDIKNKKAILKKHTITLIILLGLGIVSTIILGKNYFIYGVLGIIGLYLGKRIFHLSIDIRSSEDTIANKEIIENINSEINSIEEELLSHKETVNATSYEDFIRKLKLYDDFIIYEEKEIQKIKDKEIQLSLIDAEKLKENYKNNITYLNKIVNIANANNVSEVLDMISRYDEVNKEFIYLKIEIQNGREDLQRLNEELIVREKRIREKLEILDLKEIDLFDLEEKLLEIKEKVKQREEIKRSLASIDETYEVLTRGKDIESIKEELKDIINQEIEYSYSSEEEIDIQVKEKSNELIEIEKNIKDVENDINNRFKGKRTIAEIEEDIENVKENIFKLELKLKATELAIEKLKEAFNEERNNFGPLLNEKVLYYFRRLTKGKYEAVMVSDTYEIKVRDKESVFQGTLLSNGANDQLYLSLRLAFISMLYKDKEIPVVLDDAFIQYDDERTKIILDILLECKFGQLMIFTCQKREIEMMKEKNFKSNYIFI